MKVYTIEVVEVQHIIYHCYVKASSEVEAKAKAKNGFTSYDINEFDIDNISHRIVEYTIKVLDSDPV